MEGIFLLKDVYRIKGIGIVLNGEVIRGQIKTGMSLCIENQTYNINKIEKNHINVEIGNEGENVGLLVDDRHPEIFDRYKEKELVFSDNTQISGNYNNKITNNINDNMNPKSNKPKGFFSKLFGK
ncbi:MAG: hypothetical protein KC550_03490 [Nanoarchaeota archaeon]|nr:hypothetical protein [Nanoarchaeota archaeon]